MKYTIDRFEDGFAVLEDENRIMADVPIEQLPVEAKEGDVLLLENGAYRLDNEETARRRQDVEARLARLWKD